MSGGQINAQLYGSVAHDNESYRSGWKFPRTLQTGETGSIPMITPLKRSNRTAQSIKRENLEMKRFSES